MVDVPRLDPQVFSKVGGSTPRLTGQTPTLRRTPSVTSFAADSLADTYVGFADDAKRLEALSSRQFEFSTQQFQKFQAETEEIQLVEAEAEYNKIIMEAEKAVQNTRLNSSLDSVVKDSVGAYDNVQKQILSSTSLSAFQRNYLGPKLDKVRSSVAKSAYGFQRSARQEEARHTLQEGIEAREFIVNEHPDKLAEIIEESTETIDTVGAYLPQTERTRLKEAQRERLVIAAASGEISKNPALALEKINSGIYNGTLNLKQVQTLKKDAEVGIRKQEAEFAKVEAARRSRIDADLGVAISVGSLDQIPTQTKLDQLRDQGTITDSQWEQHTKARFGRLNKEVKVDEDLKLGTYILENKLPVNPESKDAVKAFNTAYENSQEAIAALPPAQRVQYSVDLIKTHRAVPDMLKGEMKLAARSGQPEQVKIAADMVDKISKEAPYLMDQLITTKDRKRIDMINQRLDIGMEQREAILQTDQQLSILNQASNESIQQELTSLTQGIDFREVSVDMFDSFINPFDRPETTGQAAFPVDRAAAVARIAYEDAYRQTRDENIAEQKMREAVTGRFGSTDINGVNQVMEFPPENYFSIQGEDNGWMRDQMIDAAKEITKGDMLDTRAGKLEDRVMIIPDAFLTPKLAAKGRPGYNLVLMGLDGVPRRLNPEGQLFFFDPSKRRKELVQEVQ